MIADRTPALLLFSHDWDRLAFELLGSRFRFDHAGFDLFAFPSQLGLWRFDVERFADRLARRHRRRGWRAVVSHHEQFGALAAAMLAERIELPGTPVDAVLACQHKLHARRVLAQVAPEANIAFEAVPARYGDAIPAGLRYPGFAKPVKAAFSVLARRVDDRDALQAMTRFDRLERWIIAQLVEPFDRVARRRLHEAGSAHRLLIEEPLDAPQFNLDGWVADGRLGLLGTVDATMYPGTQAFARFDLPGSLPADVVRRALDVARRFLWAVGFTRGLFNMEFFVEPATGRVRVIEFNPRLASQFGDLYRRTIGIDPHALSLSLACGEPGPSELGPKRSVGAAASVVFRAFRAGDVPARPDAVALRWLEATLPGATLLWMGKRGAALERELRWLGSHRWAVLNLGAPDAAAIEAAIDTVCARFGWPRPPQRPQAPLACASPDVAQSARSRVAATQ